MAESVTPHAAPQRGDRKKHLLVVVDGDGAHLYFTSILLQRLEYNIHTAKSAEDAIEIIRLAHPALVLTETSLPGMDGVALLKMIKHDPQTFAVPVVMLTASRDPVIKATCMDAGCKAYLQKPLEPDALYAAIQKATETAPRQFIRLNTCLNVIVGDEQAAGASVINDYITALSENGTYVSTSNPMAAGTRMPLTIFFENEKIRTEGVVLYSFQRGEGPLRTPGMGIKFVSIRSEDQALIRSFIRRELTKGLSAGKIGESIF